MGAVIGLTGLPCSGKSTVAAAWQECGAHVLDVDCVGHAVIEEKAVREALAQWYGEAVVAAGSPVNRGVLGQRVFATPTELARLEALVHPLMVERVKTEIAAYENEAWVLDAAVLISMGLAETCDFVVLVTAPLPIRIKRACARGWDIDKLKRRSDRLEREIAEYRDGFAFTVENNGVLADVSDAARALWKEIKNAKENQ